MKNLITLLALAFSATAFAHSGGTDSSGCHNDHKRGGYHCHKSDGTLITDQKARNPASAEQKEEDLKEKKIEKVEDK